MARQSNHMKNETLSERAFAPWSRADLPLVVLASAALVAPFAVLGQGGDWHTAILAGCVVLGTPGAALEAMLGVTRLAVWIEPPRD